MMKRLMVALLTMLTAHAANAQEPCDPPPKMSGEWINPVTQEPEIYCYWSALNDCPDAVWFRQFARTNEAGELITGWMYPTQLLTQTGLRDTNGMFVWDPKFIAFFPPPNNLISRAVPIDLVNFGTPPMLPTPPPIPDLQPLAFGAIDADGKIVPAAAKVKAKAPAKPQGKRKKKRR